MVEPATLDDIIHVAVNMRPDDYAEVMACRWDNSPFSFAVDHARTSGPKFVARAMDGTPVGVGGIAFNRPGVGQAWLIGTPRIGECRREIMRIGRATNHQVLHETNQAHRIQAFSASTHTDAHRWLCMMGFTHESTMPRYGKQGEDFMIFSIVKKESL